MRAATDHHYAGGVAMTTDNRQDAQNSPTPEKGHAPKRFRLWWIVLPLILLLATGVFVYQGKKTAAAAKLAAAQAASQSTPVLAVAAKRVDVNVYLSGLGSVTALNTVVVKSRIDGQLMEVHFKEGQNVRRGDLLATIDPRPFQVQLTLAEGQMARDQELLRNARLDLERYKVLWKQDSIPKQQLDTQDALVRQYVGAVKISQGLIDSARLQLTYSRITAPVSGRVGLRQVDAGNIVHASDANGLVVITQLQPITVVFPLPEDNLPRLLAKVRTGGRLEVDAYDREQKLKLASGSFLTVDNQIDPTTGTVKVKAVFLNSDSELFPNQFVNAKLLIDVRRNAVVIPTAAIQRGAQGTFVYLVKADKTVTVRPVTLDVGQGDDIAVSAGLEQGELVVVDGAERLREGSRVEVKDSGKTKNKGSAGTQGQGTKRTP